MTGDLSSRTLLEPWGLIGSAFLGLPDAYQIALRTTVFLPRWERAGRHHVIGYGVPETALPNLTRKTKREVSQAEADALLVRAFVAYFEPHADVLVPGLEDRGQRSALALLIHGTHYLALGQSGVVRSLRGLRTEQAASDMLRWCGVVGEAGDRPVYDEATLLRRVAERSLLLGSMISPGSASEILSPPATTGRVVALDEDYVRARVALLRHDERGRALGLVL